MTPEEIVARMEEMDAEILLLEPRETFDACLVGVAERFNSVFAVYSRKCVLEAFARDMPDDDPDYPPDLAALEHYSFNVVGGWLGDGTPAFMIDEEE